MKRYTAENTGDKFKPEDHMTEEETIKFLGVKKRALEHLVRRKLLTVTYAPFGFARHYEKDAVVKFFEARKTHHQNKEALANYAELNRVKIKTLAGETNRLNLAERKFVASKVAVLLQLFKEIETNAHSYREYEILTDVVMHNMPFDDMATKYDLDAKRVAKIFAAIVERFKTRCLAMKRQYDQNYLPLKEENATLRQEVRRLNKKLEEALTMQKQKQTTEQLLEQNPATKSKLLDTPIEDLDLSVRLMNCLENADIITLGEISEYGRGEFRKIRNFGTFCMNELDGLMKEFQLEYGDKIMTSKTLVADTP